MANLFFFITNLVFTVEFYGKLCGVIGKKVDKFPYYIIT